MYLDANFFIIANFDAGPKGKKARTILGQILSGKEAVTSALAMDEVMWVLHKQRKEELRDVIEEIYSLPNVSVKAVSPDIPLSALNFMEENRLKPRDAFHAAVMKELGIKEIVSDDPDFDKVKEIKRISL